MWKKLDLDDAASESQERTLPSPKRQPAAKEPATIGPSISIRGDLTGEEDLVIDGRVDGTIDLQQNNLTVGEDGRVKANVRANTITVDGEVEGDLSGDEQVVIRRTGHVRGNMTAPRVTLEDGCRFKGSIDMDAARNAEKSSRPKIASGPRPLTKPEPEKPLPEVAVEQKVANT